MTEYRTKSNERYLEVTNRTDGRTDFGKRLMQPINRWPENNVHLLPVDRMRSTERCRRYLSHFSQTR